jgi:hypothetical protein
MRMRGHAKLRICRLCGRTMRAATASNSWTTSWVPLAGPLSLAGVSIRRRNPTTVVPSVITWQPGSPALGGRTGTIGTTRFQTLFQAASLQGRTTCSTSGSMTTSTLRPTRSPPTSTPASSVVRTPAATAAVVARACAAALCSLLTTAQEMSVWDGSVFLGCPIVPPGAEMWLHVAKPPGDAGVAGTMDTVAVLNIEPKCNICYLFSLSLRFWRVQYMGG